ncbi:unnamed protein product [Vitrella brassicaformis CCMP3155]|uniref:3'(2'),5'-bisphosphate nucleotidase 1 n=2 Tax=Vitrella brassicaformis TaxID=1169539 RepID=A0A0G4GG03_VITBC|nr:unnamed protein product [Vitrella brassicaformis CCMP3155]|mmetsp:Transcript_24874/g.61496  ORF Transcript_24874/g.61496 Transcript_24874/m.61496 type:complete len:580 (+) Transcript_24874:50-1789(+)|eukprot:CEM28464.1 unnamed protein product [Vitrella brassicaformis CCMP3155]
MGALIFLCFAVSLLSAVSSRDAFCEHPKFSLPVKGAGTVHIHLSAVVNLAIGAGLKIVDHLKDAPFSGELQVESKDAPQDLVTSADRLSDEYIRGGKWTETGKTIINDKGKPEKEMVFKKTEGLTALRQWKGIDALSEEESSEGFPETYWLVDPLDGTSNFAGDAKKWMGQVRSFSSSPDKGKLYQEMKKVLAAEWTVMVALVHKNKAVAGVVTVPWKRVAYYGVVKGGDVAIDSPDGRFACRLVYGEGPWSEGTARRMHEKAASNTPLTAYGGGCIQGLEAPHIRPGSLVQKIGSDKNHNDAYDAYDYFLSRHPSGPMFNFREVEITKPGAKVTTTNVQEFGSSLKFLMVIDPELLWFYDGGSVSRQPEPRCGETMIWSANPKLYDVIYPRIAPLKAWDTAAAHAILNAGGAMILRVDCDNEGNREYGKETGPFSFTVSGEEVGYSRTEGPDQCVANTRHHQDVPTLKTKKEFQDYFIAMGPLDVAGSGKSLTEMLSGHCLKDPKTQQKTPMTCLQRKNTCAEEDMSHLNMSHLSQCASEAYGRTPDEGHKKTAVRGNPKAHSASSALEMPVATAAAV